MVINILKRDKKYIVLILFIDIILSISGLVLSLFLGYSLDILTISKDYSIIIKISMLFIVIYVIISILQYFNQILVTKYSNDKISKMIDFIIKYIYGRLSKCLKQRLGILI